jgi:DNA repair exonuclease SbcCD nuclease subunit
MPKILLTSDAHYSLKSAGTSRTDEIHRVMMEIADHAIGNGVDLFVHSGDLGHIANPSSQIHALWMELFGKLEAARIRSVFMLGNHDAVHKVGCVDGSLDPLARLHFEYVRAVTVPEIITNCGPFIACFLPYVSKTHLPKGKDLDGYLNDFIEANRNLIDNRYTFVFTHLNPPQIELAEDFILRPIHGVVPAKLFEMNIGAVFSGHYHSPQLIREEHPQHWIVGAPICTTFGDSEEKRCLLININEGYVEEPHFDLHIESIPTSAIRLKEIKIDLVDQEPVLPDVDSFGDLSNTGIKVSLRCTEDQVGQLDLDGFRAQLESVALWVRPIMPIVIRRNNAWKTIVKAGMDDLTAVKAWVDDRQPSQREGILEAAVEALERN